MLRLSAFRRSAYWTMVSKGSLAVLVVLIATGGCGGGAAEEPPKETAAAEEASTEGDASASKNPFEEMAKAGKQMQEMSKRMQERRNQSIEPVDFRKLRAVLPEAVGGLERTAHEGEKSSTMGMSISTAEATYKDEEQHRVEVKITDAGGLTSFAMLGFGWAMREVDRESSSGYEKTVRYQGHKAFEKYDRDRQRGEMQVLVADRFVVEVTGREVAMDVVKEALAQIDLSTLAGMKDEGVQEG